MKTKIILVVLLQTIFVAVMFAQEDKLVVEQFDDGSAYYSLKKYKDYEAKYLIPKHFLTSEKYRNVTRKYLLDLAAFGEETVAKIGWPFDEKFYVPFDRSWLDKKILFGIYLTNKGKAVYVHIYVPADVKVKDKEKLIKLLQELGKWDRPYYNKFARTAPDSTIYQTGF